MQALERLTELASNGGEVDRGELVEALTDLFVAFNGAKADKLGLLFGTVVSGIIDHLEDESRKILAERVGDHDRLPRVLAKRLAEDDVIEIARKIIENSTVLTTEDLVSIAETQSQDHLLALAERSNGLNAMVTDVLVRRGSSEVLKTVTDNEQASISIDGFDVLVGKARKDTDLQEALVKRSDLPPDPAKRLIPFLDKGIRERLEEIAGNPRLVELFSQVAAEKVRSQLREFGAAQTQTDQAIVALQTGKATIDDVVIFFSKNDKPVDLALVLAKIGNVAEAVATRLVLKGDDAPLILLCRAWTCRPRRSTTSSRCGPAGCG
ncbi:DUF2336 domain-containing protein [Breoghania sp. L-A4]|uniref:DUF2336 domain-containing protein n=1 Tax=Breoghania sp. L-A4 TaxID=2304600 RepID=UPI000E35D332|nr:DUF2336 domain-containing protein [Breoghania sp. L-A4]AXS41364.1 DUF2336 domain-containing protein [Breoghania sp. L-A4]